MSTARKLAPGSVPGIRSWRHRIAEHDRRQRVEVSDDDRIVATAEVTTSEGSGGTARVSLRAEPGHISPGARRPGRRCARSPRGAGKRARGGGIPARRWRVTAPASGALRGRPYPPGWVEHALGCEPSARPRRAAHPISRQGTSAGRITIACWPRVRCPHLRGTPGAHRQPAAMASLISGSCPHRSGHRQCRLCSVPHAHRAGDRRGLRDRHRVYRRVRAAQPARPAQHHPAVDDHRGHPGLLPDRAGHPQGSAGFGGRPGLAAHSRHRGDSRAGRRRAAGPDAGVAPVADAQRRYADTAKAFALLGHGRQ